MLQKMQSISPLKCLFSLIASACLALPSFGQNTLVGTSTMSVKIVDVLQLTVNTNSSALDFNTAQHFTDGVSSTVTDQLKVFSSRPYDLKVKSNSNTLSGGTDPSVSIPISNISIETANTTGIGTTATLALSETDQTFVTKAPSTLGKNISMKYFTSAGNMAFMIPGNTYSSTLTFTIAAN